MVPDLLAIDLIGYWLGIFLTLAILSFLYKDNPIYKLAEHLFVDIDYSEVQKGDRFLLCSDGLTRDLRDADVAALLRDGSPTQACQTLLNAALERGGGDNTTVIVTEAGPR